MSDSREIAVKASVDVGDNIINLIRQLAEQIGTTTDKVFPWYVKQQVIEGWAFFVTCGLSFVVGVILVALTWKKCDWVYSKGLIPFCIIGIIFSLVALVISFLLGGDFAAKILNPEFYALKSMVSDMSKLLHK